MSVNNNKKYLIDEIKRLERENLDIYKDKIKLEKRLQTHRQRINDIIYQFGIYCLHYLHTKECDIDMLLRWHFDYLDILRVEKDLCIKLSKIEHTYRINQVLIKDKKIDAGIFGDIKWVSRCKNE